MTQPDEIDKLYNPSISDIELNERHGKDRPVIYLDEAHKAITTMIQTNSNQWFQFMINEVGYEKARQYKDIIALSKPIDGGTE